ncbi:lysozyme family protein [Virgibacillus sp. AGTR]|uniref:lysozyme family protein n=1 Tax=Virgibacillus sp. AGTR TaxID=2812055 RepID=UPI001D16DF1E|nr:lysozyme family protein [Virgibacillus sp. AGTR]MCC2251784.1 lysozyme family protein [Virgibacillus sp. AGTR]
MKKLGCLVPLVIPVVILFMLVVGVIIAVTGSNGTTGSGSSGEVEGEYTFNAMNQAVERYRIYFEKYANENGIGEYVDILMAMTMQETGGRLADVMQSSESLGLPVNTITDPEESIKQGVSYFANVLEQADGKIKLALQAYNMGNGFIDYAKKHNNGEYSRALAFEFGEVMASRLGWSNYGDENYVDHVMRFLDKKEAVVSGNGQWSLPLKNIRINSEFGPRRHPVTGELNKFHGGLDFGCTPADSIMSVANGEVVEAVHSNIGYGNYVTVKHGSNEYSRYAHMSSISVSNGDVVNQGETLGKCGTTGTSTGTHLHLEHITQLGQPHNEKSNPRNILGLEAK